MFLGKARLIALAVVLCTIAGPAAAEDTPDYEAAKRHFKLGRTFLAAANIERSWSSLCYAEAINEFQRAYEITKDGLVMGQVAVAYEKGGDYEGAKRAMLIYREALPEGERASADPIIKKYDEAIAAGRSKPLAKPLAKPLVKPAEPTTPAASPTSMKSGDPAVADKPVAPADTDPNSAKPAEATPAGADPFAVESAGAEEEPKHFWTWIAAGAAGALALGALVVGLNAQAKFDELEDLCAPGCPQSDVDSVKTRALASDVLWGTAAAAAVTAGILYFVEGRSNKKERTVQIAPMVGGGRLGLGASARF